MIFAKDDTAQKLSKYCRKRSEFLLKRGLFGGGHFEFSRNLNTAKKDLTTAKFKRQTEK